MKKFTLLLTLLFVLTTTVFGFAGGPIKAQFNPPLPPIPLTLPAPSPVIPAAPAIVEEPTIAAVEPNIFGNIGVYLADYSVGLTLQNFGKLNFVDAFGWSSKVAMNELTIGCVVPKYLEGSFTWQLPVERTGSGIPTIPISVGGYTFGPRAADTIRMDTSLSSNRLILSLPLFGEKLFMPTGMCELWRLSVKINGTPTTTSTSQPPVDVRQDFNKLITGIGVSGEASYKELPAKITYQAIYVVGGYTKGWHAQAALKISNKHLSVMGGYKFVSRSVGFGENIFDATSEGPFFSFGLLY